MLEKEGVVSQILSLEQLKLNIVIDSSLYLKDPESSKLGKKIVGKGIEMMEEMGYEFFSFMKLGDKIEVLLEFKNNENITLYPTLKIKPPKL